MSAAVHAHPATGPVLGVAGKPRKVLSDAGMRGRWWRFAAILVITAVVLVPIFVTVILALTPGPNSTTTGLSDSSAALKAWMVTRNASSTPLG